MKDEKLKGKIVDLIKEVVHNDLDIDKVAGYIIEEVNKKTIYCTICNGIVVNHNEFGFALCDDCDRVLREFNKSNLDKPVFKYKVND